MKLFFKTKNNTEQKTQEKSTKYMSEFQGSKNPYMNAKFEWNERYSSFIKEIKIWRTLSFSLMIALIICIIGFVLLSNKSRITAFYVQTDKLGKPIVIEKVDPTTNLNSSVVAYQLAEFVTQVRTVTTDGKLKKMWMLSAQKYSSDVTWNTLQEYWAINPPDKISQVMNISVVVDSVLPIASTESWELTWTETASKNGETVGSTKWRGIFNIGLKTVKKEQEFIQNPTGLLIKSVNWIMVK